MDSNSEKRDLEETLNRIDQEIDQWQKLVEFYRLEKNHEALKNAENNLQLQQSIRRLVIRKERSEK